MIIKVGGGLEPLCPIGVYAYVCRITSLPTKVYFSAITVKNIYKSFTHKMAAKASWH